MRARIVPTGLLAAAVVALWLVISHDGRHRVTLTVPRAESVIPGLRVRASGRPVGTVEQATVTRDHRARLVLRLDDEVWPLPVDTRLELRTGGTIKFTDRYLELRRGRARATIPEDGAVPARNYSYPVEFDEFFATFDRPTRASLKGLLDTGGPALRSARNALPAALRDAPSGLREVEAVFADLGDDRPALDTLVRSSDAVVDAVHRADPGLGALVSDAATTLDAVGRESRALRGTLGEAPETLASARRVLARADGTLTRAGTFTRRARVGVARLRGVTGPLAGVLGTVLRVGPDAQRTLATTRAAGPDLDRLLDETRSLMPGIGEIGRQAATQLACIRPYSPEIAGFFSTWGPGAFGSSDGKDTYLRAQLGTFPFPDAVPFGSDTLTRLFPVKMAYPRPPGDLVGQPWYQPKCGVDPSAYDAAADPESNLGGGAARGRSGGGG
jgi:phospholipid/cholesterol/gamma-HCH transport system substrate-binding protein